MTTQNSSSQVTKQQQTTNLGGTAVGTGIAADRDFARLVTKSLSDVTGYQFTKPDDLIEASSNTAGMLRFMGTLKTIAVKVSKLCNDLRLMSSGPRCGINEILLPAVQPHTSLIPGKTCAVARRGEGSRLLPSPLAYSTIWSKCSISTHDLVPDC